MKCSRHKLLTVFIVLTLLLSQFAILKLISKVNANPDTYYMRSDQHTINGLLGYKLLTSNTASYIEIQKDAYDTGSQTVYWYSDVLVRHSDSTQTLLGNNIAQVSRTVNGGFTEQNATWNCPETSLLTTDAIRVSVYTSFGAVGSDENFLATFITTQLGAAQLDANTWTFSYWTKRFYHATLQTHTRSYFRFGDSAYPSRISGISLTVSSVTLNSPAHNSEIWEQDSTVDFNYTPSSSLTAIQNSSLWTNMSGAWTRTKWNDTLITAGSPDIINYTFADDITVIWNIQVFNNSIAFWASANWTVTIDVPQYVTLNQPADNSWTLSFTINFNYTPSVYQQIKNASLWTNEDGWSRKQWNATTVTNGTLNTISETFDNAGVYLWNVQVFVVTDSSWFALSNYTIKILENVRTVQLYARKEFGQNQWDVEGSQPYVDIKSSDLSEPATERIYTSTVNEYSYEFSFEHLTQATIITDVKCLLSFNCSSVIYTLTIGVFNGFTWKNYTKGSVSWSWKTIDVYAHINTTIHLYYARVKFYSDDSAGTCSVDAVALNITYSADYSNEYTIFEGDYSDATQESIGRHIFHNPYGQKAYYTLYANKTGANYKVVLSWSKTLTSWQSLTVRDCSTFPVESCTFYYIEYEEKIIIVIAYMFNDLLKFKHANVSHTTTTPTLSSETEIRGHTSSESTYNPTITIDDKGYCWVAYTHVNSSNYHNLHCKITTTPYSFSGWSTEQELFDDIEVNKESYGVIATLGLKGVNQTVLIFKFYSTLTIKAVGTYQFEWDGSTLTKPWGETYTDAYQWDDENLSGVIRKTGTNPKIQFIYSHKYGIWYGVVERRATPSMEISTCRQYDKRWIEAPDSMAICITKNGTLRGTAFAFENETGVIYVGVADGVEWGWTRVYKIALQNATEYPKYISVEWDTNEEPTFMRIIYTGSLTNEVRMMEVYLEQTTGNLFSITSETSQILTNSADRFAIVFHIIESYTLSNVTLLVKRFGYPGVMRFGVQYDTWSGGAHAPNGTWLDYQDYNCSLLSSDWQWFTFNITASLVYPPDASAFYDVVIEPQGTLATDKRFDMRTSSPQHQYFPKSWEYINDFTTLKKVGGSWTNTAETPIVIFTRQSGTQEGQPYYDLVDSDVYGNNWKAELTSVGSSERQMAVNSITFMCKKTGTPSPLSVMIKYTNGTLVCEQEILTATEATTSYATYSRTFNEDFYLGGEVRIIFKSSSSTSGNKWTIQVSATDSDYASLTYDGTDSIFQTSASAGLSWTNQTAQDLYFELTIIYSTVFVPFSATYTFSETVNFALSGFAWKAKLVITTETSITTILYFGWAEATVFITETMIITSQPQPLKELGNIFWSSLTIIADFFSFKALSMTTTETVTITTTLETKKECIFIETETTQTTSTLYKWRESLFTQTETILATATNLAWKALSHTSTAIVTVTSAMIKTAELFMLEMEVIETATTSITATLNIWRELIFIQTETLTSILTNIFQRELAVTETETITATSQSYKWGEYLFIQTETVQTTTQLQRWRELLFQFFEDIITTGLQQIWPEQATPPQAPVIYHLPIDTNIPLGRKVHFGNYWIEATSGTKIKITVWFESGWTKYDVNGAGTQNIYNGTKPTHVYIDTVEKAEGDGWSYTDGIVTVTDATSSTYLQWGAIDEMTFWETMFITATGLVWRALMFSFTQIIQIITSSLVWRALTIIQTAIVNLASSVLNWRALAIYLTETVNINVLPQFLKEALMTEITETAISQITASLHTWREIIFTFSTTANPISALAYLGRETATYLFETVAPLIANIVWRALSFMATEIVSITGIGSFLFEIMVTSIEYSMVVTPQSGAYFTTELITVSAVNTALAIALLALIMALSAIAMVGSKKQE